MEYSAISRNMNMCKNGYYCQNYDKLKESGTKLLVISIWYLKMILIKLLEKLKDPGTWYILSHIL